MLIHQVIHDDAPSPRKFNGSVSRDLETICLKCLEKETDRRYRSAKEVSEEFRRYLAGKPIQARHITSFARGWRWCRRNRLVASLGALLGAALVVLGIAGPIIALRQTNLRHRAEDATKQAEQTTRQLRQRIYSADMNVAYRAAREGNLGLAVELLRKQLPTPGEGDLRGFEWRYIWGLSRDDAVHTFPPFRLMASVVEFAPDGNSLVTGSFDGTLRLWQMGDLGRGYESFEALALRDSAKLSSKGLLFANRALELVLMDLTTKKVQSFGTVSVKDPRTSNLPVAISKDESWVASATDEGVRVWKFDEPTESRVIPSGDQHFGMLVAFSSDENVLSIANLHQLVFWDLQSNEAVAIFDGNNSEIVCLDGAKQEPLYAIGRRDGSVDLLKVVAGKISAKTWKAHASLTFGLAFSPDGRFLATGGTDQMIHLWDVDALLSLSLDVRPLTTLRGHENQIWALAFAPDGTLASASKDRQAKLWDPRWSTTVRKTEDTAIEFVSLNAEDVSRYFGRDVYSHDRSMLARLPRVGPSAALQLLDAKTEEVLFSLDGYEPYSGMAFSPSDQLLATGRVDNAIQISDIATGTSRDVLRGHFTLASALAFSPDGRTLVSGGTDGTVKLWNLATGQEMISYSYPNGLVVDLKFSPSGNSLGMQFVSLSCQESVEIWHAPSWEEIEGAVPKLRERPSPRTAARLPDP